MKLKVPRIKPASKTSSALHVVLNLLIVVMMLFSVRQGFAMIGSGILLLSKWRMFAVKPRHWLAHMRANLVDIAVGLAVITFWNTTANLLTQLLLAIAYLGWLLWLKPKSSHFWVLIQALLAQTVALIALYSGYGRWPVLILVILSWLIGYACARHFFSNYEEPNVRILAHIWGIFMAEMAWWMSHWTLYYGFLPQIALVSSVISYTFAAGYYVHKTRGLKPSLRNQFIIIAIVLLAVIVLFSQWQYSGF